MSRPPLDIAHTLSPSWVDQLKTFIPDGVEKPYHERLKAIVTIHGEQSIVIEDVQRLALWYFEGRDTEEKAVVGPFPELSEMLTRVVAAVGEEMWLVTLPLDESSRMPHKDVFDLSVDLSTIRSEWQTIDHFIEAGWVPVKSNRENGQPDWIIHKNEQGIEIEVKNKEAIGSARHRLQWAWRGLSLLPEMRPLHDFSWRLDAPDQIRNEDAKIICGILFDTRHQVISLLQRSKKECCESLGVVSNQNNRLRFESWGNNTLYIRTDDWSFMIVGSPGQCGGKVFEFSTGEARWPPHDLGENELQQIKDFVARLNIRR